MGKRKTIYNVVSTLDDYGKTLDELVTEEINDGWILQGGVCVVKVDEELLAFQALTKRVDVEND